MTVALLAAVSLFALVVSSRPLPDTALSALQTVQAAFQILPGKYDQFQKPNQQIEYFSTLAAPIASFEISSGVASSLDDRQKPRIDTAVADEKPTMAPLVVLAFSCVAAFLVLACIALTLYIIKSVRSQMFASEAAWKLLPQFWKCPQDSSAKSEKHRLGNGHLLLHPDRLLNAEEGSTETHGIHTEDKPLYFDATSDVESEADDVDEKYQDALDMTPLLRMLDLPLEQNVSHPSHVDDPPLPSTESYPLDPDRSTPLMRELCSYPISRPAWSVRAIDSPALGLSSRQSDDVGSASTCQPRPQQLPLVHPHRRAYRSAVPEFDIALAMQLLPGLGIGADSAWMVRFLMTIFGWFTVALTGHAR